MSSDFHPTSPASDAFMTRCMSALQSGDVAQIERAIVALNEYMSTAIAAGECPCYRLPLDAPCRTDGREVHRCEWCGHLWTRLEPGSRVTWTDAGLLASEGHSGNPAAAGEPSPETRQILDQSGKGASHEQ